jgi:hypothetical protein
MERVKIAPDYNEQWFEIDRPQPLCDNYLEKLFTETATGFGGSKPDHSISIYTEFERKATKFIFESKLNNFSGIENFCYIDIISGCTQFIDNLYMQGPVQIINGDYKYHERLGYALLSNIGNLKKEIPLIISMPFPTLGSLHPLMNDLLNECSDKKIPVHVDGAWVTCCRDINFDFGHPSIESVGISLSKGLGLGWNRVGLRWSKRKINDSITIANNFHMQNRMPIMVANYVLDQVAPDYLWNKYYKINEKICKDFNLTQTNAIHIAKTKNKTVVGLSPLIRYLNNE